VDEPDVSFAGRRVVGHDSRACGRRRLRAGPATRKDDLPPACGLRGTGNATAWPRARSRPPCSREAAPDPARRSARHLLHRGDALRLRRVHPARDLARDSALRAVTAV